MTSPIKLDKRFKQLTKRISNISGRSQGQIVVRHRNGFNKRLYRFIDLKRLLLPNSLGLILRHQYNPKPHNHLALVCFAHGLFTHIILPSKVQAGDLVQNYTNTPRHAGDSAPLAYLPAGGLIHNLSLRPLGSGRLIRSSGCSAILVRRDAIVSLVKLKSGELRYFNSSNTGTLGSIGDETHFLRDHKKAGTIRYLGRRPIVRASAMNPVDHPMGGRTKGGTQPLSPQGRLLFHRSTKYHHSPYIIQTQRSLKFKK